MKEAEVERLESILLIHGIWGGGWFFDEWVNALGDVYECIRPTLAEGFIEKGKEPKAADYVASLLEDPRVRGADHIVGYSSGALLACLLSEHVTPASLALICPAPPKGCWPSATPTALGAGARLMMQMLGRQWIPPDRRALQNLGMNEVSPLKHQSFLRQFHVESRAFLIELGLQAIEIRPELLSKNVLVVKAMQDRTISCRSVDSTARRLGVTAFEVEGAGHFLPKEKMGESVLRELVAFFQSSMEELEQ